MLKDPEVGLPWLSRVIPGLQMQEALVLSLMREPESGYHDEDQVQHINKHLKKKKLHQ